MSYQQQPQRYGAPASTASTTTRPQGTMGREALFGVISAALILPSLIFHFANQELFTRMSGTGAQWASFGSFLGMYIYFVLVVAFMGRTIARRFGAVVIGLLGAAISSGTYAMSIENFQNYYDTFGSIERAIVPASSFLFVVAWGISRRKHSLWLVGLIPAIGILSFSEYLYFTSIFGRLNVGSNRDPATFLAYWANDVGSVVLAVLVCWGFDAAGRSLSNKSQPPQQQPFQSYHQRPEYGSASHPPFHAQNAATYGFGQPSQQQDHPAPPVRQPTPVAPQDPLHQTPAPISDAGTADRENPPPRRPTRFAEEYETGLEEPVSEPNPVPQQSVPLVQPAPAPAYFAPPSEPLRNAYGEVIPPPVQQQPAAPGYGYGYGQQQPSVPPTYGPPTGG